MPRTSAQARSNTRFTLETPPPPPPSELSEEQQKAWREICADLRRGHIRSDTVSVPAELVCQLSYSAKLQPIDQGQWVVVNLCAANGG
jgi:hypothetical protein